MTALNESLQFKPLITSGNIFLKIKPDSLIGNIREYLFIKEIRLRSEHISFVFTHQQSLILTFEHIDQDIFIFITIFPSNRVSTCVHNLKKLRT